MTDPQVPFKRGSDVIDAANIPYTPAVLTDWDGNADPGSTRAALDQLAERVDDNEIAIAALGAPTYVRRLTVVIGAENLDTIAVTITVKDAEGNAIAGTDTLLVGLYNNAYLSSTANSASFPISDVGAGAIVSSDDGGVSRHICTTANGVLALRITDANGASGSTLHLSVELWHNGSAGLTAGRLVTTVTFNGA